MNNNNTNGFDKSDISRRDLMTILAGAGLATSAVGGAGTVRGAGENSLDCGEIGSCVSDVPSFSEPVWSVMRTKANSDDSWPTRERRALQWKTLSYYGADLIEPAAVDGPDKVWRHLFQVDAISVRGERDTTEDCPIKPFGDWSMDIDIELSAKQDSNPEVSYGVSKSAWNGNCFDSSILINSEDDQSECFVDIHDFPQPDDYEGDPVNPYTQLFEENWDDLSHAERAKTILEELDIENDVEGNETASVVPLWAGGFSLALGHIFPHAALTYSIIQIALEMYDNSQNPDIQEPVDFADPTSYSKSIPVNSGSFLGYSLTFTVEVEPAETNESDTFELVTNFGSTDTSIGEPIGMEIGIRPEPVPDLPSNEIIGTEDIVRKHLAMPWEWGELDGEGTTLVSAETTPPDTAPQPTINAPESVALNEEFPFAVELQKEGRREPIYYIISIRGPLGVDDGITYCTDCSEVNGSGTHEFEHAFSDIGDGVATITVVAIDQTGLSAIEDTQIAINTEDGGVVLPTGGPDDVRVPVSSSYNFLVPVGTDQWVVS